MNTKAIYVLLFAATLLFSLTSCTGSTENTAGSITEGQPEAHAENDRHGHGDHDHDVPKTEKQAYQGSITKEAATALLNAYLELKDGLVSSDAEKAKSGANKILAVFTPDVVMDATLEAIKEDAEHIAGTGAVSHQRDHFNSLSNNVLAVVEATNANQGKLFVQHCPMAFDGKGAIWLSANEEIRNPYFGDKMLKCGKTIETVK